MSQPFMPPGLHSLADVDVVDVLYESECVLVQGVVSPSGQGGWPGRNDGYQVHCFSLAAWHRPGEAIVECQLTILRPVPPDVHYFDDFPANSIQRFSVLLSTDGTRAVFEHVFPPEFPADDLQAIAAELQKPVTMSSERFGTLVLDRRIGNFDGEAEWNGESIRISFNTDGDGSIGDGLATADLLWSDQTEWTRRIEEYAVNELLESKNEAWLDEGEPELTAWDFISRMTLQTIAISPGGEFAFWYDDGDLFCGHAIEVRGNLEDGPWDAGIHG